MACRRRATRSGSTSRAASWRRSRPVRCSGCWARRISARSDDYTTEKMPAVNVGLLDGQLAWRQHDGGHTDGPNWKYFIPWADQFLTITPTPARAALRADRRGSPPHGSELAARPRAVAGEGQAGPHRHLLRRRFDHAALGRDRLSGAARQLEAELLRLECGRFRLGRRPDSRTSSGGWRTANWTASIRRSSCCWRAPTMSAIAPPGGRDARSRTSRRGLKAIVRVDAGARRPSATIILTGDLPAQRQHGRDARRSTRSTRNLAKLADGRKVRFLNVNDKLADANGKLFDGMMNARQAASDADGLSGLGGRAEADLHRTARPARQGRPCAAAHGRSERASSGREFEPAIGPQDNSAFRARGSYSRRSRRSTSPGSGRPAAAPARRGARSADRAAPGPRWPRRRARAIEGRGGERPPCGLRDPQHQRQRQRDGEQLPDVARRARAARAAIPAQPVPRLAREGLRADAVLDDVRGEDHADRRAPPPACP